VTRSGRNSQLAMALLIGMIAYGSLYPFAFHAVPGGVGPLRMLLDRWDMTPGRGDFVSNILLYVPLGFVGMISVGRRASLWRLAAVIAIGGALSLSMESLQYYDAGRDPQATDFYSNTLGTIIGASVGWVFGQDFRWPLLGEISANRIPALLLWAWVGYRLYPYEPTINLHKYWDALKPVLLDPHMTPYTLFRQAAIWLTVAVLIEKIVGREKSKAVYRRFAGFIVLASILIISTWLSISQILGMALAYAVWRGLSPWPRAPTVIAATMLAIYVAAFRLEPFQLVSIGGHYSWMPFLSFMKGSIDLDVQSFFEKFFLYGGLIWLLVQAGMALRFASACVAAILMATSAVEIYIPGRSAEVTDAIFALIIGEFIRATEMGAPEGLCVPRLNLTMILRIRHRFAIGRGEPLSSHIVYLPADGGAE
jgi:VanZ family protein